MSGRILCSTGCFVGRANGRNFYLIEKYADKLSCDGFEFMMYSSWYARLRELGDFLVSTGLSFPTMHCEKHIGEWFTTGEEYAVRSALRLFECNCELARRIGADRLVLHLWNGLPSDSRFENNLAVFGSLEKIAADRGVTIVVENVVCHEKEPMIHWRQLAEMYPEVRFLFDTKMAAFHNEVDALFSDEYEWLWQQNRIRHLHINDYGGGYMDWHALKVLPIGSGKVDFDSFFGNLKKRGYSGDYTVEATALRPDGSVDIDMLNGCFEKIRDYLR